MYVQVTRIIQHSISLVYVQAKLVGEQFYTKSFWLDDKLVFVINQMNLGIREWYSKGKKYPNKSLVNTLLVEQTRVTSEVH